MTGEAPYGLPPAPPPMEPRVAAAVVLWRERERERELFWVRRAEPLSFAGGFHAFPGGRLDAEDLEIPVEGASGREAALIACAARELFEETGVLVARGAAEVPAGVREAARRELLDGRMRFEEFLTVNALSVEAAPFVPAGRWITPSHQPLRYDAQLFLLAAPAGEEPVVWPGELAHGEWIRPGEALRRWSAGEALLHPPNHWAIRCLGEAPPPACLAAMRAPPFVEDHTARRIEFQQGLFVVPLRTPTVPPASHTNCYLVRLEDGGGRGLAVVDPGARDGAELERLQQVLGELAAEGLGAREIWLTHEHPDHTGGVGPLRARLGATLRAHPACAARLPSDAGAAEPLADGAPLGGRWRALHTPGHARGHVSFHDERTGALLCGDMVSTLSTVVIDPPEGDMAEYLRQLARLAALSPRTLYPGHGPPATRAADKLREYLAHREAREEKVIAALATPGSLSLGEVTARAYVDTPRPMLPLAARSCLASLLKLAAEGRAREDGGRWTRA